MLKLTLNGFVPPLPHTFSLRSNYLVRRREACTEFWWGNLRDIEHWGEPGVDGRTLRWIFRKWDVGV
jgi:hypothetical protein